MTADLYGPQMRHQQESGKLFFYLTFAHNVHPTKIILHKKRKLDLRFFMASWDLIQNKNSVSWKGLWVFMIRFSMVRRIVSLFLVQFRVLS